MILVDGRRPCLNGRRLSAFLGPRKGRSPLAEPPATTTQLTHAGRSGEANTAQRRAQRIHENRGKTTEITEIMKTMESRTFNLYKDLRPW